MVFEVKNISGSCFRVSHLLSFPSESCFDFCCKCAKMGVACAIYLTLCTIVFNVCAYLVKEYDRLFCECTVLISICVILFHVSAILSFIYTMLINICTT